MQKKCGFVSLLLAILAPSQSLACSCLQASLEEQFALADFVILGRVSAASQLNRSMEWSSADRVDVEVTPYEAFKGNLDSMPPLHTAVSSASCGVEMTVGHTYLLFFMEDGRIGLCSGSRKLLPTTRSFQEYETTLEKLRSLGSQ